MSDLTSYLALAHALADAARPVVLKHFRSGLAIDSKADDSPVTIADREVETTMRAMINEHCPDHGILGEEHGPENIDAEYVWVLDPIDGTHGFVTGKPLFGTLIALCRNAKPVLGIIDTPATGERWAGCAGHPTTFNGEDVRVRACSDIGDAWMYATTPDMFEGDNLPPWQRLTDAVLKTGYGVDCYAYGLLASGHVDMVCEAMLQPYDYCALVPVIEGAGGVISDWQGHALSLHSDGRVIAAGDPSAHQAGLAALAG